MLTKSYGSPFQSFSLIAKNDGMANKQQWFVELEIMTSCYRYLLSNIAKDELSMSSIL